VDEAAGGSSRRRQPWRLAVRGELDPLSVPVGRRQKSGTLGVLGDPDVGERLERVRRLLALQLQARCRMGATGCSRPGHPLEEL